MAALGLLRLQAEKQTYFFRSHLPSAVPPPKAGERFCGLFAQAISSSGKGVFARNEPWHYFLFQSLPREIYSFLPCFFAGSLFAAGPSP
jgi:hypothetical protein